MCNVTVETSIEITALITKAWIEEVFDVNDYIVIMHDMATELDNELISIDANALETAIKYCIDSSMTEYDKMVTIASIVPSILHAKVLDEVLTRFTENIIKAYTNYNAKECKVYFPKDILSILRYLKDDRDLHNFYKNTITAFEQIGDIEGFHELITNDGEYHFLEDLWANSGASKMEDTFAIVKDAVNNPDKYINS